MIPLYPLEAFHPIVKEIVEEYRKVLRLNPDFLGTAMLFAFSVACGNRFRLKIKNGWVESAVLYAVIVGKAGVNKSAPMKIALDPLKAHDKASFDRYKAAMAEFGDGRKSKENPTELPKRQQFLISDFTPEALSMAHEHNPMGLGVYSDELATWLGNMGRYSKSGEEQFYLSLWSSIEININRRSSPHIYIPLPFVSVIGGIQPSLLPDVFGKTRAKNGFTHRMLFAFPDEVLREDLADTDVSQSIVRTYKDLICRLSEPTQATVLELSAEAYEAFKQWRNTNNERINQETNEDLAGIYSKMDSYLLRLALLLQLINNICEERAHEAVEVDAIQSAVLLIHYYEQTAIKVNRIVNRDEDPLSGYSEDKRILFSLLTDEFLTDEAKKAAVVARVSERSLFEFLKDESLFKKLRHGFYIKLK